MARELKGIHPELEFLRVMVDAVPGPRVPKAHAMSHDKVSLREKLDRIESPWTPKIVGELNGQQMKLARLEGEFVWHHHEHEDELFLVISGSLKIELREHAVTLEPGEFFIVPRGVEHRPVGMPAAEVLLLEPVGTLNTGNLTNERTVRDPERI